MASDSLFPSQGPTLWLTGLPCSGKTTLAQALLDFFKQAGLQAEHLDGDVIRQLFGHDLGYSRRDREAQGDRAALAASVLTKNGIWTIVSLISPYRAMRENARHLIGEPFIEIFVSCPLEICERRDVKGLYRLARSGRIRQFTGVSDPYEEPLDAELTVHTGRDDVQSCVEQILSHATVKPLLPCGASRSSFR